MSYKETYSEALRAADVRKAADAALLSLRRGLWLNRATAINFSAAKLGRSDARKFLQFYKNHARRWLAKKRAGPLACIEVFENTGGYGVHLLLHVPVGLWPQYEKAQAQWLTSGLAKYDGVENLSVLRDQPIINYRSFVRGGASERDYLKQLRGAVRYMMKGATRINTAAFMGLDDDEAATAAKSKPFPQGGVWGRRASISHVLLSSSVRPPLHPDPKLSWLDDAEREAEAGRILHHATLALGDPPPTLPPRRKP